MSRNAGKCRKKIGSLEEEMKDMTTRREGLRDTLASLEDEAREILAKQEKIRVRGVAVRRASRRSEKILTSCGKNWRRRVK